MILCAYKDLQKGSNPEQAQAQEFFGSANGCWQRSREFWCEVADVDADAIQEKALGRQRC